ncbi:MAG TPA: hypothetical protein VIQ27_17845 [Gemmatimonadales bacterium]|jgi:hypothetical protein
MRIWLLVVAAFWPAAAVAQACEQPPRIPRHVIAEAMRAHGPYSLTSTTTAMIFGSEALLAIVRRRQREAPGATQFMIDQEDWFKAHQETAGVDYAAMSESARTAYEHRQDVLVDYGPQVVQEVEEGAVPRLALDITLFSSDPDGPSEFGYKDTLSVPKVEVYNTRVVRFRMLEYDSLLLYDDVSGVSVKPLGFLSAIFALVGRPDVKQTRLAVGRDYWQVMRGRVNVMLGISKTGTATFEPDGRGHERIPPDRADLAALAKQLAQPLEVRYGAPSCLARRLASRAADTCRNPMGGTGSC